MLVECSHYVHPLRDYPDVRRYGRLRQERFVSDARKKKKKLPCLLTTSLSSKAQERLNANADIDFQSQGQRGSRWFGNAPIPPNTSWHLPYTDNEANHLASWRIWASWSQQSSFRERDARETTNIKYMFLWLHHGRDSAVPNVLTIKDIVAAVALY